MIFINSNFVTPFQSNNNAYINEEKGFPQELKSANGDSILFQGTESSLNITDIGNLYEYNQEVSLSNQEEINSTYYLDDDHDWIVSNITTYINNIQDTREWVNDSGFQSINGSLNTVIDPYDTFPKYGNGETKGSSLLNITHPGAVAMRVHFDSIAFEEDYDFLFIEDKNDILCYQDTGYRNDFYSPWVRGDTMQIYIISDGSVFDDGYDISSYQYINGTFDNDWWGFNDNSISPTYYGLGQIDNNKAMYLSLISDRWYSGIESGYYR